MPASVKYIRNTPARKKRPSTQHTRAWAASQRGQKVARAKALAKQRGVPFDPDTVGQRPYIAPGFTGTKEARIAAACKAVAAKYRTPKLADAIFDLIGEPKQSILKRS